MTDGPRARGWIGLRLVIDLFRPGATSLGVVVPLIVMMTVLAVLAALVGQMIVPWAIYPAL